MKYDQPFKLASCRVLPSECAIELSTAEKVSLQPKFIELLCYLAEQFPRVVPRDEIIEVIWAGNEYVGENALTNAIWHLRQNLKGINGDTDVIETIRKVGYRLLVTPEYQLHTVPNSSQTVNEHQESLPKKAPNYWYLSLSIVIIFVSLVFIWQQNNKAAIFSQPLITQITKEPGSELFASPSPNGDKVVFKWIDETDSANLYITDRKNPALAPVQLTFGDGYISHSIWSNDGQYLYYAEKARDRQSCNIMQLKVATNQKSAITTCPLKGGYYYLDISADNNTLAFHGYREPADDNGIYFLDLTDLSRQPWRFSCSKNCGYRERDFSFSPDGKYIALSRRVNRFNENLYLVDLKTKDTVKLTQGQEDIVGITWHPNSKQLVYAAQRADVRNGYVVDISSKLTEPLNIPGFSYPAFAKKSGELFFQQRQEKYHLANLSLTSDIASSPFPVIQSEFSHQNPHYSPKQDKVAYISNESGFYELWIADRDGKNRKQLTNLQKVVRYPRWSNSGDKIAFLGPVNDELAEKIYIYDLQNNQLSVVPSEHLHHNRPTWSYDDQSIISAVYEKEYADLHLINIKSGESKRISFDGGRFGIMTTESTLLYTNQHSGLWQKDLTSTNKPIKKISGKVFNTTYTWAYTPTGIYFKRNYNNQNIFAYYDLFLRDVTPIVRLPRRSLPLTTSLSFIDKTQELLFTGSQSPQSDIKQLVHPLLHPID